MPAANLEDIGLRQFQYLYLLLAFGARVLTRDGRTTEERLVATKMIASVDDPTPTVVVLLVFCPRPMKILAGAYLKFLRFAGVDRADPVIDSKRFDGPLHEPMRRLDRVRLSLIRSTVEIGPERAALNRANLSSRRQATGSQRCPVSFLRIVRRPRSAVLVQR